MLFSFFQKEHLHQPWLKQKAFGIQDNGGRFWYPEDFISFRDENQSINFLGLFSQVW